MSSDQLSKENVGLFDVQLINAYKRLHHASAEQFILCISVKHVAM